MEEQNRLKKELLSKALADRSVWNNCLNTLLLNVQTATQCILWIILSSGLLRSVGWFRTDVWGLPISPIFKGQVFKKKARVLKHSIM
jgi:hypothetical protein